jgi:chitodextrinase
MSRAFAIERCVDSGCINFAPLQTVAANVIGYTDSGLAAQKLYRYRVRAYNTAGNSQYSNIAEATTPAPPPPPPPSAPTGLTAAAISYNHVELSWADNSGDEEGFRIERCAGTIASCTSFVQIGQVIADINGLSDLGVQGQTTYTYRVRAFNSNGQSAYSNSAQVTTPAAPANTQVVPSGVQRIGAAPGALNWTGTGVGVAVVDTGLDFNHADLGLLPEIPGVNSFNATAMGTTCQDIHGHGTHVAGIIGAKNNLIDVVGVAPNTTIYCVNVFEPDPDNGVSATDESLIAGLDWILAHANTLNPKIRVVNLSLGREKVIGDDNPNHPLRLAIRALYNAGISIVVAAGNDPLLEVMNEVPAFYPEVMAVASTTAKMALMATPKNSRLVRELRLSGPTPHPTSPQTVLSSAERASPFPLQAKHAKICSISVGLASSSLSGFFRCRQAAVRSNFPAQVWQRRMWPESSR